MKKGQTTKKKLPFFFNICTSLATKKHKMPSKMQNSTNDYKQNTQRIAFSAKVDFDVVIEWPITPEELGYRRGKHPKSGMIIVKEHKKRPHRSRRFVK